MDMRRAIQQVQLELISKELSEWDWEQFFTWCSKLGGQLDGPSWRTVKGLFMGEACQIISDGKARHVDEEGFDLLLRGKRIEMKGEKKGVFCMTIQETKSLQLKNPHGTKKSFKQKFDYLLILQTAPIYRVAITTWEVADKYKSATGDQYLTKIPFDDLIFITPEEGVVLDSNYEEAIPLLEILKTAISDWLDEN